jgi:hypothetical protein
MAEKDVDYRVGAAGSGSSESPDPYEVSAGNKAEVGNSPLTVTACR